MLNPDRRVLVAVALCVLALPALARAAAKPLNVLFVCQAGTAKSPMARELFRKRARERGIAVTTFSRGVKIADHVSPLLRSRLDADGIDTQREGFEPLSSADVRKADMLVTFSPLPPGLRARKLIDWTGVASVNDHYAIARRDIDRRIDALLDAIAAEKGVRQ